MQVGDRVSRGDSKGMITRAEPGAVNVEVTWDDGVIEALEPTELSKIDEAPPMRTLSPGLHVNESKLRGDRFEDDGE